MAHGDMVLRVWRKLEPHIEHHRSQVGKGHASGFENLARLAEEYRRKNLADEPLLIVDAWS